MANYKGTAAAKAASGGHRILQGGGNQILKEWEENGGGGIKGEGIGYHLEFEKWLTTDHVDDVNAKVLSNTWNWSNNNQQNQIC